MEMLPENEHSTDEKVSFRYHELSAKVRMAEERLNKIQ